MAAVERPRTGYIAGLDGLRAVAILAVIFCHADAASVWFPPGRLDRVYAELVGAGWVGVDLFFVLSGFLITGILFASREQPFFFRNFYMRRALRIFPLYYVYSIFVLFAMPALGGHLGSSDWRHGHVLDKASVLLYFYNIEVAITGRHLLLLNHLWSLCVEEHYYLLWPLIVHRLSRRTLLRITLIGVAVSFVCRFFVLRTHLPILAACEMTPSHLDGLLLGSFVALAWTDASLRERLRRLAPSTAAAGLICVLALTAYQHHFYLGIEPGEQPGVPSSAAGLLFGITALSVLFASVLVIVLQGGALTRWLEHPVLRRIGVLSYGIYVYHVVFLWFGYDALHVTPLWTRVPMPVLKLILSIFDAAASTAFAAVSYRFLEQPFLRLKRRFPERGHPTAVAGTLA